MTGWASSRRRPSRTRRWPFATLAHAPPDASIAAIARRRPAGCMAASPSGSPTSRGRAPSADAATPTSSRRCGGGSREAASTFRRARHAAARRSSNEARARRLPDAASRCGRGPRRACRRRSLSCESATCPARQRQQRQDGEALRRTRRDGGHDGGGAHHGGGPLSSTMRRGRADRDRVRRAVASAAHGVGARRQELRRTVIKRPQLRALGGGSSPTVLRVGRSRQGELATSTRGSSRDQGEARGRAQRGARRAAQHSRGGSHARGGGAETIPARAGAVGRPRWRRRRLSAPRARASWRGGKRRPERARACPRRRPRRDGQRADRFVGDADLWIWTFYSDDTTGEIAALRTSHRRREIGARSAGTAAAPRAKSPRRTRGARCAATQHPAQSPPVTGARSPSMEIDALGARALELARRRWLLRAPHHHQDFTERGASPSERARADGGERRDAAGAGYPELRASGTSRREHRPRLAAPLPQPRTRASSWSCSRRQENDTKLPAKLWPAVRRRGARARVGRLESRATFAKPKKIFVSTATTCRLWMNERRPAQLRAVLGPHARGGRRGAGGGRQRGRTPRCG